MRKRNKLLSNLTLLYVAMTLPLLAHGQSRTKAPVRTSAVFTSATEPRITVGPNVRVSKAFGDKPHLETHVAANPRNRLNLIGGSMVWSQEQDLQTVVAYASFDGGKTWSPTLTFDDGFYHADPAAGFSPDGTAYFLQITNTGGREPKYYTHVYRSKDGGKTWLSPTIIPMLDRNYVVVDDTQSKYRGSLYINGLSSRAIQIQRSKDGGASFDGEIQALAAATGRRFTGQAPCVILSDGTLVVPFAETDRQPDADMEGSPTKPNATLKIVISEDGGATFSDPVTISDIALGHDLTSNTGHFSFGVNRSDGPFKDRLYVAWTDSYSGGSQWSRRRSRGSNILLSYSANKGNTWSKPIMINDDRPPPILKDAHVHFQPVVAVNQDGVVGLMWYDRRDSSNDLDWTVRFTASLDGGETFLPSVKVSESPYTYSKIEKMVVSARGYGGGHKPPNRDFSGDSLKFDLSISQANLAGGHTAGLAADANGIFQPFWVDNRTGIAQVWTAPVTVLGKALRNGNAELSMLEDVSEKVILRYANTHYEPSTGSLSVDVQIENVSLDTIVIPVKLRVVMLVSNAGGIPRVIGADNGENGVGAIWDFGKFIVDKKLKPDRKSVVRRLEFNIAEIPPLNEAAIDSRGWGALELIHVEARVLANVNRKVQPAAK